VEVRETRSGLLLAEETAAPSQIREALKRIDPDLILGQDVDQAWSCFVWKLLLRRGDQPAVWLTDWREDMHDGHSRPRPLSFGIVEEAWALRKGSRRPHVEDVLKANDELIAKADEYDAEEAIALGRETVKRSRTLSPVHRSRGLYLSRAKARREGRI
jgi:hypothetical protein